MPLFLYSNGICKGFKAVPGQTVRICFPLITEAKSMGISVGEQSQCPPVINTSLAWKNAVGLERSCVSFASRDFWNVPGPLASIPPVTFILPPHSNEVKEDVNGLHVWVSSPEAAAGTKWVNFFHSDVCFGGCVVFCTIETTGKTRRLHLKVSWYFRLSP